MRKTRKTRKQLEKERLVLAILKTACGLAAFCLIISLIKIAAVMAYKGDDVNYVSDLSLVYIRVGIAIHAFLALSAILSRHYLLMISTLVLTVALFVAAFTTAIYADAHECVSEPQKPCQYALVYTETNIYDF